jgi:hypothetical protein
MSKKPIQAVFYLALALVASLASCSPDPQVTPPSNVATTAPTTVAASPGPYDKAALIASLELPVKNFPDIHSLATAIMADRYTAWGNQSATQEARDEFLDPATNMSGDDFAQEKVLEMADVYPKALFIEGWERIPSLVRDADGQTKHSGSVLGRRLITWDDEAPYERFMAVDNVTLVAGSMEEGEVSFRVDWTDSSNAAENKIGRKYDKNDTIPETGTRTITAVAVGGKWKISQIQFP